MTDRIGDYTITGVLGQGAQGVVYRGVDPDGRLVAVKMLHTRHGDDPDLRARFDRECRVSRGIHHPNVVESYAHGELEGKPWMASELVAGGSLDARLRRGRLDPEATMRVAVSLFAGLGAIHAAGLIHRDIKPANLLFTSGGVLKIVDLGFARPTEGDRTRFTMTGGVVGTPSYLAPEQITDGDRADIRADLYSAGITLYECLSGDVPFQADAMVDLLLAHLDKPPPPLAVMPGMPPAIAAFVHRLLAKAPADRFPEPKAALAVARELAGGNDRPLTDLLPAPGDAANLDSDVSLAFASTLEPGPIPLPARKPTASEPTPAGQPIDRRGGLDAVLIAEGPTQPSALLPLADGSRIFCYAGPRVVLGRETPRTDPFQVCVRLFPAQELAERTMRLSSRHVQLVIGSDGVLLRDLRSSLGTVVDERRLPPGDQVVVAGRTVVRLADVIELVIRVLPSAGRFAVGTLAADHAAPSVLITRRANGVSHRYLVVGGAVDLDHPRLATGLGVLIAAGGGLWRREGDTARAVLGEPTPFIAIAPEHHKG